MSRMSFIHGVVVTGASEAPMPSRRREAEASFPAWHREELLGIVLNRSPPWGRCPATSWAHERGAFVAPLPCRRGSGRWNSQRLTRSSWGEWFRQGRIHCTSDTRRRQWRRLQMMEPSERLEEKRAINPPTWRANCQCFFAPTRYMVVPSSAIALELLNKNYWHHLH
jgi:hypothetical protein